MKVYLAPIFQPLLTNVLLTEVLSSGLCHDFRPDEPVCLPVETSFNHPLQNTGRFSHQLGLKVAIYHRWLARERDHVYPAAHCVIDVAQNGFMVPDDGELELRI